MENIKTAEDVLRKYVNAIMEEELTDKRWEKVKTDPDTHHVISAMQEFASLQSSKDKERTYTREEVFNIIKH